MEMWTEVRRRVLTGELSKRAACQQYGINWRTLAKMLSHVEPPGYRRQSQREQPVLGPHLAWVHEVLEQDKQEPKKQRHTATTNYAGWTPRSRIKDVTDGLGKTAILGEKHIAAIDLGKALCTSARDSCGTNGYDNPPLTALGAVGT